MPGMLTCSSNGIDGGVNETAVQMMDYLYDFLVWDDPPAAGKPHYGGRQW